MGSSRKVGTGERGMRIILKRTGELNASSFERMAREETSAFRRCEALHSRRRCVRSHYSSAQQFVKGMYAVFLQDWVASFPSRQLLLVRLEDHRAALPASLRAVLAFLRLPQPPPTRWRRMLAQPRANRRLDGARMLAATRLMLRGFYAPFNAALTQLTGDARFLDWRASE